MKIHHLDCGSLCPLGGRLIDGESSFFARGSMVCHCLLLEMGSELILVDTGLGTSDLADPRGRLGNLFLHLTAPRFLREQTALAHVERLGFQRRDVRHIVPTHFDLDHVGGLSDFPEATVHAFEAEHAAAARPATLLERHRYRPVQLAHGPRYQVHRAGGEKWLGFESIRAIGDEVLLVPLAGHTRGHCGVAVRDGNGWLLHAGDAYFFRGEIDAERPHCPPGLLAFQTLIAHDDGQRRRNRDRLRTLAKEQAGSVRVFSAHDPRELLSAQARAS
jgi:glyoxylase-like metal-dependent hydrolase (beta-lactamase superfamily II)